MRFYKNRTAILEIFPKQSTGVEIGVFKGDYTEQLLRLVQPEKLYLIDTWPDKFINNGSEIYNGQDLFNVVLNRFNTQIQEEKIICLRSSSTEAAPFFKDESLDWIYIDADHSYNAVYADLKSYYAKIRPGGLIAGHDYVPESKTGKLYGVIDAVDKFIQEYRFEIIALTEDFYKTYVIRKI